LNNLYLSIGLNPDITMLNGFEFGVNIKLPFNPNIVLESLILHKSCSGLTDKTGKRFEYQNYTVKIYNKSYQCKIEPYKFENILRIEIKVTKMEYLKKHVHCKVLSDLLEVFIWEQFQTLLVEAVNDFLIIDLSKAEQDMLSDKEQNSYLQYINPLFWTKLYNGTRENRSGYGRERAKCNAFIKNHSKSTIQTEILNLVVAKCCELRDVSKVDRIIKTWNKLTVLPNDYKDSTCDRLTVLPKTRLNEECDELPIKMNAYFVAVEDSGMVEVKRCKVCGEIIHHPTNGQLFCSAKVVGYKRTHKCRDKASNAKKSIRRILSTPSLFELSEFIADDKRKYLDNM